jgi:hypothetical protein
MRESLHVVCPHCDRTNRLPREQLGDAAQCGNCHRPLFEGKPLLLNDPTRFARHTQHSDERPTREEVFGRVRRQRTPGASSGPARRYWRRINFAALPFIGGTFCPTSCP